jgi:hypothetical protein
VGLKSPWANPADRPAYRSGSDSMAASRADRAPAESAGATAVQRAVDISERRPGEAHTEGRSSAKVSTRRRAGTSAPTAVASGTGTTPPSSRSDPTRPSTHAVTTRSPDVASTSGSGGSPADAKRDASSRWRTTLPAPVAGSRRR